MAKILEAEFELFKSFIEEECGIHIQKGKEYLIETRLSDMLDELSCRSYYEFYKKITSDISGKLKNRIIDAMTTNETYWFRDESTWEYLEKVLVPSFIEKLKAGNKIRIWSAAASTGQEIYSLGILFNALLKKQNALHLLNSIEFFATDISFSALLIAKAGRYGSLAMSRGLTSDVLDKYFVKDMNVWILDAELRKKVTFQQFNLQNSFISLGVFDLILCRNVIIYFSEAFRAKLFVKLFNTLKPSGILLLGNSEFIRGLSGQFETR